MIRWSRYFVATFLLAGVAPLMVGCEMDVPQQDPLEETTEEPGEGAEDTGNTVEEGVGTDVEG